MRMVQVRTLRGLVRRRGVVRLLAWPALALRRIVLRRSSSRGSLGEQCRRILAEPPLVRLPEFHGEFRVPVASDLLVRLLLHGSYEPVLSGIADVLLDCSRDVVDVGANVGFFSVSMAVQGARRVIAVEPTEAARRLLLENLRINGVQGRVAVLDGVIAAQSGTATLHVIPGKEEYSSTGHIAHSAVNEGVSLSREVPSRTLSEVVRDAGISPGLVKIDVEGGELSVLAGADEVLDRDRPALVCEFSPSLLRARGIVPGRILERLYDHGYVVRDPELPRFKPGGRPYGEVVAVPQEKMSEKELIALIEHIHTTVDGSRYQ